MAQEIGDLTEKEKEALRLLVEGHDAKSSANLLGLSVHTVNDRLRNARRKLGVSSSREAARILRDVEGEAPQTIPQIPAHTSFGIADKGTPADTVILNQHRQKGPTRLIWLAGGMLIMSLLIATAIFAAVASSGEASSSSASGEAQDTNASVMSTLSDQRDAKSYATAVRFLAEVDSGDWEGSWDVAGNFIQQQVSKEKWAETVKPVREPLGTVLSRELTNVQKTDSLPNAPAGEYEILQFATAFQGSEAGLTETVIMIRNADGFDIAGYFIR